MANFYGSGYDSIAQQEAQAQARAQQAAQFAASLAAQRQQENRIAGQQQWENQFRVNQQPLIQAQREQDYKLKQAEIASDLARNTAYVKERDRTVAASTEAEEYKRASDAIDEMTQAGKVVDMNALAKTFENVSPAGMFALAQKAQASYAALQDTVTEAQGLADTVNQAQQSKQLVAQLESSLKEAQDSPKGVWFTQDRKNIADSVEGLKFQLEQARRLHEASKQEAEAILKSKNVRSMIKNEGGQWRPMFQIQAPPPMAQIGQPPAAPQGMQPQGPAAVVAPPQMQAQPAAPTALPPELLQQANIYHRLKARNGGKPPTSEQWFEALAQIGAQ